MTDPCQRPECGGETHTDGWGNPIQCPARRCPRCDCPDNAPQCEHCKVCPHATTTRCCPLVHREPHDAHGDCPGWTPDDGTRPESPPASTPLEEAQATVESLRYQIRRAREALATGELDSADAAVARVRALHREECGSCEHCTRADSVPYPCPTIRALDGGT
ncbi:hypothetical protein ABZ733_07190 [Streptomyces longwoodensis]|uniref:hypothetical protein n=1 Tax=Streptomyces longwoodensis TaxID=68231 RepID=UPI003411E420